MVFEERVKPEYPEKTQNFDRLNYLTFLNRSLKHDHIVHFFGVSLRMRKEIAVATLVLERCTESLGNYMFGHSDSQARASKQAAWMWAKEITEGLAYIHDQGFIHGHLKLENIWV